MNRELIVFILFLFVNISVSINCFFYQYAGRKAGEAWKERKENKPKSIYTSIPSQSKNFYEIIEAKIESDNFYQIIFLMKDKKDFCLRLIKEKKSYLGTDLASCNNEKKENQIETKWIISKGHEFEYSFGQSVKLILNSNFLDKIFLIENFRKKLDIFTLDSQNKEINAVRSLPLDSKESKEFLNSGKYNITENQFNSALFIRAISGSKTYILLFQDKSSSKLNRINLHWDTSYNQNDSNFQPAQLRQAFWETMQPIGFVIDVITYPIQVVGLFIYIMIFGLK